MPKSNTTALYLLVIIDFTSWNYFIGNCRLSSSVCVWQYSKKFILAKSSVNLQLSSILGAKNSVSVRTGFDDTASRKPEH